MNKQKKGRKQFTVVIDLDIFEACNAVRKRSWPEIIEEALKRESGNACCDECDGCGINMSIGDEYYCPKCNGSGVA